MDNKTKIAELYEADRQATIGQADYNYDACCNCERDPVYGGHCEGPHHGALRINYDGDIICENYSNCREDDKE